MTREEQRKEKELKEQEFKINEQKYCEECFDINSEYYYKMISILNSSKDRELSKEIGFELHHKIPKSFFRKKNMKVIDKGNLYKLTYSEHFMVHYYAYKCATKIMKNSMSLALLQMKRVCTKSLGCSDYDAENLSKLFDNIKIEIYENKNKKSSQQNIEFWNKRIKNKSDNFELIQRIKQQDQIWKLKCHNCEYEFAENIHSFLRTNMKCPNCNYSEYSEEIKIPKYLSDYFVNNYKDKDFEKRFLEVVHKMYELDSDKDFK